MNLFKRNRNRQKLAIPAYMLRPTIDDVPPESLSHLQSARVPPQEPEGQLEADLQVELTPPVPTAAGEEPVAEKPSRFGSTNSKVRSLQSLFSGNGPQPTEEAASSHTASMFLEILLIGSLLFVATFFATLAS